MKHHVAFLIILAFVFSCSPRSAPAEVRPSSLAGRWYQDDPIKLATDVDELFKNVKQGTLKNPLVLIVPHAGYAYSGTTAADAYSMVKGMNPGVIVILGTAHHVPVHGCALTAVDFFETPVGRVPVRKDIVLRLAEKDLFREDRDAHREEHSVEIQLPLLQKIFAAGFARGTGIVPVLVGGIDEREAGIIAASLTQAIRGEKNPLVIISSDFTHYGPRFGYVPFRAGGAAELREKLKKLDYGAVDCILKKDCSGFSKYVDTTGITICGADAIKVGLAMPIDACSATLIRYRTSIDSTGDLENTVSYVAAALCGKLSAAGPALAAEKGSLSDDDKKTLLSLARQNIAAAVDGKEQATVDASKLSPSCLAKRGAFVTLKKNGELRGCIGYIAAERPLYRTVLENALNAAFSDPRFNPVQKKELPALKIEISVLTEPVEAGSVDEIIPGSDGLIIERGPYRGLLLPQVAVEYGWDRETFLEQTCLKAGLSPSAWREKGTKIYRFQAIVFGEHE